MREKELGRVELRRGLGKFKQGLACQLINHFNNCMVCA